MNTLEKLTLEAFQLALGRVDEPLPNALAQKIQAVSEDWEAHISELRDLAAQFEPLETQYAEARLELQSLSAERKQFLENGFLAIGENKNSQVMLLDRVIESTPGVCGGHPRISGTRIPVWTLVSLQQQGADEPELLRNFPSLNPKDLQQVWVYYDRHREVIDQAIASHQED
jgi:uncharacterized protein (DUF433 family)